MENIIRNVPIENGLEQIDQIISSKLLSDYSAKVFSQNGEDGILYYIFSKIGVTNKKCIEISGGDGIECNCANLLQNHDFTGLVFEANMYWVQLGVEHYKKINKSDNIKFVHGFVTCENILEILKHFPEYLGTVDLLSMDIDGVDYWILKTIMESKLVKPRVIVVEYQDIIGPELALTVPYIPDFDCGNYDNWHGPNYAGASLQAFIHLLKDDYVFIGCEALGFNGFFLHKDELGKGIDEMTDVTPCFKAEKVQFGMNVRWPRTKNMKWIDVSR